MGNWIRNAAGSLVRREIVGWGQHFVSFTASPAERAIHAIERLNGYELVAACGEPTPNGFRNESETPPRGDTFSPRCSSCEGIALDLLGIPAAI